MTALEHIKAAEKSEFVDEDGNRSSITLLPGLDEAAIQEIEKQVGQRLPTELRETLRFCSEIEGLSFEIDFTGGTMGFGQEEIFPNGLPIAADGFGNFWVIDITPETNAAAPVFFACHDAPVILYQSENVATFLAEVFKMAGPPHKSLVDDVHEDRLFDVWRKNPGVIEREVAASSGDVSLRAFAESLPANFQIIDLRNPQPGMGFSWGRYGAQTEIRRHGFERLFAYGKPEKKGLLSKLFGR
jgi:cell wall assembly regulator SMI1